MRVEIGTLGDSVSFEADTVEAALKFISTDGVEIKRALEALNVAVPIEVSVGQTVQVAPPKPAVPRQVIGEDCPKCGEKACVRVRLASATSTRPGKPFKNCDKCRQFIGWV